MKLKCLFISMMAVSACKAQMVVTARDSQLDVSWLYGYAGDVRTGGAADADGNLYAIDGAGLSGEDSGDGYYPPTDHHWSAAVVWDLTHGYKVSGSLGNAFKIESSGSTVLNSVQNGATCGINSVNPGNVLRLEFIVPRTWDFHIHGWLSQQGPLHRNGSTVYIYKSNGAGGWNIFYVAGIANAAFNDIRTFQAGLYRIESGAGCMAGQDESTNAAWNYTLVAACLPCDLNCDGSINLFDIQPFVDILMTGGGACSPCAGDTTFDGTVNTFDINNFIDCLD